MTGLSIDALTFEPRRAWLGTAGRAVGLGIMFCMFAAAIGLYGYKHEAFERRERIAELHDMIAKERELLALVEAEWTTLNDPARIQTLATRFLNFEPLTPEQSIRVSDLPMRPEPPKPRSVAELLEKYGVGDILGTFASRDRQDGADDPARDARPVLRGATQDDDVDVRASEASPSQEAPATTGALEVNRSGSGIADLIEGR